MPSYGLFFLLLSSITVLISFFFAFHVLHALMSGLQWSPFLSVLYSRLVLYLYKVLTLYLPELIYAECRMTMLIRHTKSFRHIVCMADSNNDQTAQCDIHISSY